MSALPNYIKDQMFQALYDRHLDEYEKGTTDWVCGMSKEELEDQLAHIVHCLNDPEDDQDINELNRFYMERYAKQQANEDMRYGGE